jgi:hypothetical protein
MKEFCENEYCENPGAKVVPVSVDKPSDQRRTLCAPCEEAYTWGVQHGTITSKSLAEMPLLSRFLGHSGFVLLVKNTGDPSQHGPFEAWAYSGPLDFQAAAPVTFGVGVSVYDALGALDNLLASVNSNANGNKAKNVSSCHCGRHHCQRGRNGDSKPAGLAIGRPPRDSGEEPLFRVAYFLDVNAANPRDAAEYAHRIMTDPRSMPPMLQIMDHAGHVSTVDLSQAAPA